MRSVDLEQAAAKLGNFACRGRESGVLV